MAIAFSHHNPFNSFWMAGFECSDHLNASRDRLDLINTTKHLDRLKTDYELLKPFGMNTVREGIRWSYAEHSPYRYDFSVVKHMLAEGKANDIQQVWDICHFGYPDDIDPLHPEFTSRFVSLCEAFVRFYLNEQPDGTLIVTPINEVSFLSWLGGEVGGTSPYCCGKGWDVKYALMRAYIAGIKAMKVIDPTIRILTTEPIVNIVPPLNAPEEEIAEAARVHEEQFQALDMLAGYICPELGGSPELLDILGFNFYYNNQWVTGFNEFLPWVNKSNDERWRPLSELLQDAFDRYKKPMVITETSHPGIDRPHWIKFIAEECQKFLADNQYLWGVCLYPIVDRPDWDTPGQWHNSGLWDEVHHADGTSTRALCQPYAEALVNAQKQVFEILKANEKLLIY